MARVGLVELIPLCCSWCNGLFAVCVGCYRGQSYCCEACRERARCEQQSAANRKYQMTPKGAENHRRRQREYRERLRLRVTEQATGALAVVSSSLCQQELEQGHEGADDPVVGKGLHPGWAGAEGFCAVCGRLGTFMEGGLSPSRWALP
jgi:hypothetical protein